MKLEAGMARRMFSREFKVEAVRPAVHERGVSGAQMSRDLDLHETCCGDG